MIAPTASVTIQRESLPGVYFTLWSLLRIADYLTPNMDYGGPNLS